MKNLLDLKIRKLTENDVKFLNKVAAGRSILHYLIAIIFVGLKWPLVKELEEGVFIPRFEVFEEWLREVLQLEDPGAFLLELCIKILAVNAEECARYGLENILLYSEPIDEKGEASDGVELN
jgi:hypothetical protein